MKNFVNKIIVIITHLLALILIIMAIGCKTYSIFKPAKIIYHKNKNHLDSTFTCDNVVYNVCHGNNLKPCYLWFYSDNFLYFAHDNILANFYTTKNPINTVCKYFEKIQKNWLWYDMDSWGFYRVSHDSIFIQYFRYIGPIIPSSVRVSEVQGRILSDNTIEIDKEVFRRPNKGPFDFRIDTTIFIPPITFKRFEVIFKPDYTKSWLYKSLWYKRYLKKNRKNDFHNG